MTPYQILERIRDDNYLLAKAFIDASMVHSAEHCLRCLRMFMDEAMGPGCMTVVQAAQHLEKEAERAAAGESPKAVAAAAGFVDGDYRTDDVYDLCSDPPAVNPCDDSPRARLARLLQRVATEELLRWVELVEGSTVAIRVEGGRVRFTAHSTYSPGMSIFSLRLRADQA